MVVAAMLGVLAHPSWVIAAAADRLQLPFLNGVTKSISGYTYHCAGHGLLPPGGFTAVPWDNYAIDFGLGLSDQPAAVLTGTAHVAFELGGYGNYVWIDHGVTPSGNHLYSLYAHMDSVASGIDGATVTANTPLGYAGRTGNASGVHLHFAMYSGSLFGSAYLAEPMSGYSDFGNYGYSGVRSPPTCDNGQWGGSGSFTSQAYSSLLIAVQGQDTQVWFQREPVADFTALGGSPQGAPAVASANGSPIYAATYNTGTLYVRTGTPTWQQLAPNPPQCVDNPAIALSGTILYVACQDVYGRLNVGQTTLPTSGLPYVPTMSFVPSRLWAGPAAAVINGVATYFVVGDTNSNGNVYINSGGSAFTQHQGWGCKSHVGVASQGLSVIFVCHGTDDNVWYAWSGNGGATWYPQIGAIKMTVFGNVDGGVGVGMAQNADAVVAVVGLDFTVYQSLIPWTKPPQGAQNRPFPVSIGTGTAAAQI